MHFQLLASILFLAPMTLARAFGNCISQSDAETLVDRFSGILSHEGSNLGSAKKTAKKILDKDFSETSDSINTLISLPLGTDTNNRKEYINQFLKNPPITSIVTIEVLVAGCERVLWQWISNGVDRGTYEVKGFNLFGVGSNGKIEHAWIEFNSIAWALNVGFNVTKPDGSLLIPTQA